ncbi:YD repeat-containing protein, partial [Caulobacter sp. UNC279MFTsu5.1]
MTCFAMDAAHAARRLALTLAASAVRSKTCFQAVSPPAAWTPRKRLKPRQNRMCFPFWASRLTLGGVLALGVSLAGSYSYAQATIEPPKPFNPTDANGVDLQSGSILMSSPTISIGPKEGGLSYSATYDTAVRAWRHSTFGGVNGPTGKPGGPAYPHTTATVMGQSMTFAQADGVGAYLPVDNPGASMAIVANYPVLTLSDGTVVQFNAPATLGLYLANKGQVAKITKPNGEVTTFTYNSTKLIQSITNNRGYQLHFDYDPADWTRLAKVTALNNAIDACDPGAVTCSFSRTWPSLTFGVIGSEQNVTDALGQTTRFFFTNNQLTGIRKPSSTSGQDVTIAWGAAYPAIGKIVSITNAAGKAWSYVYGSAPPEPAPSIYTVDTTITDPLNHTRTITIKTMDDGYELPFSRLSGVTDPLGKTTSYNYGQQGLLTSIVRPEGDADQYAYDDRGNILNYYKSPKPGSGLAAVTMTAAYPANCTASDVNAKTCNKPTSVTDFRGNTTSYTYDLAHGGVLTETSPEPTSGAMRPQTRTAYASYYAWYKNSAGTIVQAAAPIYLPTATSQCTSGPWECIGSALEAKTIIGYQAGSVGLASNLLPLTTTSGSGDGALSAITTMTYDAYGNLETVNGPLAGAADATRTYYDLMRQVVGVIGPDPDGTGALLYRASRTTYAADGQVTSVETG